MSDRAKLVEALRADAEWLFAADSKSYESYRLDPTRLLSMRRRILAAADLLDEGREEDPFDAAAHNVALLCVQWAVGPLSQIPLHIRQAIKVYHDATGAALSPEPEPKT